MLKYKSISIVELFTMSYKIDKIVFILTYALSK